MENISLKQTTNIVTGEGRRTPALQVNVLYMLLSCCRDGYFSTLSHKYITQQYHHARYALEESRKLETLLGTRERPLNLDILK